MMLLLFWSHVGDHGGERLRVIVVASLVTELLRRYPFTKQGHILVSLGSILASEEERTTLYSAQVARDMFVNGMFDRL
jgi:hypothetical protein